MSAILDEIASQPDIWRRSVTFLPEVSNRLPPDGVRAALIGCGTSYYVARAVASAREAAGFGESDAFVASEMPGGRGYDIVVALSRSGTTTEVVRALESLPAGCRSVAIAAPSTSCPMDARNIARTAVAKRVWTTERSMRSGSFRPP